MSLTRTVPAEVPSFFQSSIPWVPSLAVKKRVWPTSTWSRHEPAAAGVDVLDEDRAGRRAVAPPQLGAGEAVVGGEEDRAAHGGEALRERPSARGRCPSPWRVPAAVPSLREQLVPLAGAIGLVEERAIDVHQVRWDTNRWTRGRRP